MFKLVGLVVIFSLAVGYAFASGPGHATDWAAFRAWTLGLPHDMGIWNPYWTKLVLLPVAGLSQDIGHAWLNIITFAAVVGASNQLGAFLSFAVNDQAWVGNLDGLIIWGMILGRARNPYVAGVGLFLISIKPQYLPLALLYLWRKRDCRLFLPPLGCFLLTFLLYGNWIPEWLATFPPSPHHSVNVSFYPWALPVWLLLPLAADKERFCLAATIVAAPYFNQASLITLFAFRWSLPVLVILIALSWLAPALLGPLALVYALLVQSPVYRLSDFRDKIRQLPVVQRPIQ